MLHLTLRQLEIFTAVAHSGSTVAAAPVVALSQSATSAALQQLESGLGTPLFERAGRGLVLNDAGRALLPQALALLEQARAIEQAFGAQGAGLPVRLRVAASTTIGSYVLPRVLAALARSHPQVSVDLHIGNTREVAEAVQVLQADLGLIEGATHWPGLETAPWLRDELVLVAAPDDPLVQAARQRPLGVVALRGARWLLREQGSGTREMVDTPCCRACTSWPRPPRWAAPRLSRTAWRRAWVSAACRACWCSHCSTAALWCCCLRCCRACGAIFRCCSAQAASPRRR